MILCEVALGNIKEVGLNQNNNNDDDDTKQLDLKKFQSRKGIGQNIPDPRYTITRNYGLFSLQNSFFFFNLFFKVFVCHLVN